MKGLFIYNPSDLLSPIPGGVQICSKEFFKIIENTVDELVLFEVKFNQSLIFRLLYKLNLDNYLSYKPKNYREKLKNIISENNISHIFINKSELIRFSKTIKQMKGFISPKIIIMSHGNESGDLLGDITSKQPRYNGFFRLTSIVKLGLTLFTESWYRRRYVDLVCTMSEEETAIEKWLGINNVYFIPRLINKELISDRNPVKDRFGYVGTLNHTPNFTALNALFIAISDAKISPEIRLVGKPESIGHELAEKYNFITYLGALPENDLLNEMKSWSFFINPIFNYSRGASMKLAKAIEWELPVITTRAGKRGYFWKEGNLIEVADSPEAFVEAIKKSIDNKANYNEHINNIAKVKKSSLSEGEIGLKIRSILNNL